MAVDMIQLMNSGIWVVVWKAGEDRGLLSLLIAKV
jgi:hypothetical protein